MGSDLCFPLSTFPIHLPALRERRDDIALLAPALLQRVATPRALTLSANALALLHRHDYPGNVRELRNLLERASLLCDGDSVQASHVQQALQAGMRPSARGAFQSRHTLELAALQQAVANHSGSRAELAERLGISERSLYRKLKALDS